MGNLGTLVRAVLSGDAPAVQDSLRKLVLNLLSYHDVAAPDPERVYHAFVLGLFAELPAGYRPFSNREFGDGRPDVVLLPADPATQPTAVLEFKTPDDGETVQHAAERAAAQMAEKRYVQGVDGDKVYAWAVGFDRKKVVVSQVT